MNKKTFVLALACLVGRAALAQEALEEVVVTGSRSESSVPGTSLKRPGDFILLTVQVSNDSRDEKTRKDEITATLHAMLAAASKDKSIELSVIGDNNLVLPLKLDSATLSLVNGKRQDTSEATISVKTRIPTTVGRKIAVHGRHTASSGVVGHSACATRAHTSVMIAIHRFTRTMVPSRTTPEQAVRTIPFGHIAMFDSLISESDR